MRLKDFDYNLPKELIAQEPVNPRDSSRLLVLDKKTGKMEHKHFYNIADYLQAGDVLVLNNTKVMRARLIGKKAETGGKIEVFLLRKETPLPPFTRGANKEVWQCLIGGPKRKEGMKVEFKNGLKAEILKNNQDKTWLVGFNKKGRALMKTVEKIGEVPLPPYIKRDSIGRSRSLQNDKSKYQTVYAADNKIGSVAAPTAGLHFTKELIKKLKKQGVQFEYVTLQVGLGTFAPVKVDDITKHKMHSEWIEADGKTLARIARAKMEGRRIIAVGTTSVRVLESVFNRVMLEPRVLTSPNCHCGLDPQFSVNGKSIYINPGCRVATPATLRWRCGREPGMTNYGFWTDIFIYPGYKFKVVDAMITNFHLPKSTLLMLVSAFAQAPADKSAFTLTERSRSAGRIKILKAYKTALRKKYRFFSYGDAMLIK